MENEEYIPQKNYNPLSDWCFDCEAVLKDKNACLNCIVLKVSTDETNKNNNRR